MEKLTVTYYKFPLASIPFKDLPSLQSLNYKYIYCSSFPLIRFMGLDYHLLSVYNIFDDEAGSINDLQDKELLFGQVVSTKLSNRGSAKCIKIGSVEKHILKEDLPYLKYNSGVDVSPSGKWFYMKDGNYVVLKGIKSEYEKVKHLEGIAIYGDNIVRLRVVIELLKKKVNSGKLNLTDEEYKTIAYKVLRTDPTLLKSDEAIIREGVNNWLPSMLSTPLYSDIPTEYRGKLLL